MSHPLHQMIEQRKKGVAEGIPSYCTAHPLVLEAALKNIADTDHPVLIEATANQVNQYGGYTGQRPEDFKNFLLNLAESAHVPIGRVILGGDHLGPLIWQDLPEKEAMENSVKLLYDFAYAGFTKIHLDTSMKLADDPEGPLLTETIARRGAELYKAAMKGYENLKDKDPGALRPVFVIGSEVPIPGGAQEKEDSLKVTSPDAFRATVKTYQRVFAEEGIKEGFDDVIAVVVQPGVEFGDSQIFSYDRQKAAGLCAALKDYPSLCFEGHSTDYQSGRALKEMCEDGIAILKVGPALTFALREALFSLSFMERELVPQDEQAHFTEILEKVMVMEPKNWQKHYHGSEYELSLARRYSFSDRSRYYLGHPDVAYAMEKLFYNLRKYPIPMNMLHQYMPASFVKVQAGCLFPDPRELTMDAVVNVIKDYEDAVFCKV